MRIFGGHRHLGLEVLSEFLDGRLHGGKRERVTRQLNSCASCRDELDSLRTTVSLLRDLPDVPVPRSFTLAGPPPVAVMQRPPTPFWAPSWAYAGAASLAGLALAVMVSADATGLLTRSATARPQGSFAVQAPGPTPAPLPAAAPAIAADSAEPLSSPEPQSESAPQPEALRAAEAPKSDDPPAQRMVAPTAEPDQTPAPEEDVTSFEAAAAPQAAAAESAVESGPEGAAGPAGPAGPSGEPGTESILSGESEVGEVDSGDEEASALTQSEAESGAVSGPESEHGPVQEFAFRQAMVGTPLVWRVLEGVAAALLLLFLTVLVWQRRKARRR